MKRQYSSFNLILYCIVISIPLLLTLVVWQSNRYKNLYKELIRLEQTQGEWIESNKRLIAAITEYSSPERIEHIAVTQLGLRKIRPEDLLQVKITGGKGHEY